MNVNNKPGIMNRITHYESVYYNILCYTNNNNCGIYHLRTSVI